MKKSLRKQKYNRIIKRTISLTIATAMLMGDIPVPCLTSLFNRIPSLFTITASADDTVTYYNKTEYTKTYMDTGYIHIESWADFVWYSQSYFNYTHGKYPNTNIQHEQDVLYINIKDSVGNNYDLTGKDYVPIGNDIKPFEGRLIFTNLSADTFNVPETLFGTVSEKVSIKNVDGSAVKQITLTRVGTGSGDALFAKKVLSDNDTSTHSDWDIVLDKFDNSSAISYAGLIGEINSSANVELSFENNALTGHSDVTATADAGVVCGKLGSNATLSVDYSGNNTGYSVTSVNGNAGGIVGSMDPGSELTLSGTNLQGTSGVYAANGYAGGIVGNNNQGKITLDSAYTVNQFIHGGNGSGGLFGYYAPAPNTQGTDDETGEPITISPELDISNLTVNCTVNLASADSGYCGGLIGVLENNSTGSDLIIKGATGGTIVTSTHDSSTDGFGIITGAAGKAYGGLLGSYQAEDTSYSLTIKNIKTAPSNTLSATNYGGCIGEVIDASYVKFDTFTLNSAAGTLSGNFGGLVAQNSKGYIYAKDIIIGSSSISDFTGGGLVGDLGDGILGMNGTINLSNAQPSASDGNGIIVGKRDNALIYVDGSWVYTPNSAEVDNVGSWGDVLVIDGTKLKKDTASDSLNVFRESNHVITIGNVNTSSIANAADYAKVSLLYQIDVTKNDFIADTPSSLTSSESNKLNLTFTSDIVLTGTSLSGITRDNGTEKVSYSGTISGGHTITLDIKNVGGTADRPVYRKKYIGMIGIADDVTINNTKFSGTILSKNVRDTSSDTTAYLGSASAQVKTSFTASNCNTASELNISMTGTSYVISGRLIGEAVSAMNNISISSSTYDGAITGNGNSTVGGTIGKIGGANSNAVWSFNGITLQGHVKGIKNVGGLISDVEGSGKATIKLGTTDGIVANNSLHIEGDSSDSMGGLLGYSWSKADVEIKNVKVSGNPTVEQKNAGGAAGLVYRATGHWTVNTLYLGYTDTNSVSHAVKMLTGSSKSVGMIVNNGKIGNDGIYLELPYGYDYKLAYYTAETGGSAFKSDGVFDEICAYSASSSTDIMKNGQGIVSISTDGLTMEKSNTAADGQPESLNYTDSLSYKNQTVQGKKKNGNTRYYYNLDTIDKDNTLSASDYQKKLMRWGLNQYAASNLSSFFPDPFGETIPTGTYDMKGYSWYPVTPLNAMTINGTFKFYNEEFDECEKVKGKRTGISNDSDKNIWSPLLTDQHYMMQNGLFYNVTNNLIINDIVLQGTIGALNNSHGTGALIYGTVSGSKTDSSTNITIIDSTSGSISLDGVRIWNLSTYSGYAPLLINKASDYVTLNIKNVSTTNAYKTSDTSTLDAATSLIGKAGTNATVGASSQGITVNFSNIILDGRKAENISAYGTTPDRYNTTKSIFTRAILLEWLVGSSGVYNFPYNDDWGTGTPHKVTYGKELGYTTDGQYPNQELWYQNEKTVNGKERFVRPDNAPPDSGSTMYTDYNNFLKYVADVNTIAEIEAGTGVKRQLMVNHQPSTKIDGCGTYNDPYIIKSSTDLINISKYLSNVQLLDGVEISIDPDKDGWCDSTVNGETITLHTEHKTYTCHNGDNLCVNNADSSDKIDDDYIREYLAGAYYKIELEGVTELELASNSGFVGLGLTAATPFGFHGVIDGRKEDGSKTKIVNKTKYPLIPYSTGSVVKDIEIEVDSRSLNTSESNASKKYSIICEAPSGLYPNQDITNNNNVRSYGAVFGVIDGGDNIIDNVELNLTNLKLYLNNTNAQYLPVGGYVGVIVNGGLIFRRMTGNISGLTDNTKISSSLNKERTTMLNSDNNYWLFVNPIIGRVINGYAITETASSYNPREKDVTMKNSTSPYTTVKHYSITDVSEAEADLSLSGSTITVPNAQAFYIMSLIVNSGIGSNKYGYASSYVKRKAAYSDIGTNEPLAANCDDYNTLASTDTTSGTPYIVAKYAPGCGSIGTGTYAVSLSASSYDLPDGFRGIGNFFQNDNDLRLNVSDFGATTGNHATIIQNTQYNYFNADTNTGYLPYDSNTSGLGLFTNQPASCTFHDLTLKGNVKSCALNKSTATHIDYKNGSGNNNKNTILSVGALLGTVHVTTTINNVNLVDIDVRSSRNAGGLIGYSQGSKVNITINNNADSTNVTVYGGATIGGLIGQKNIDTKTTGYITINFNGKCFKINEIKCESEVTSNTSAVYSVGGLIGACRSNDSSTPNTNHLSISNISIENATEGEFAQITGGYFFTGGIIGGPNRTPMDITNCNIININIDADGTVGGITGNVTTHSPAILNNTHIKSTISGQKGQLIGQNSSGSGGFFGASSSTQVREVTLTDCSISGYVISASTNSGGIIGQREGLTRDNLNYSCDLILKNVIVDDCIIKGDSNVGGLVGSQKYHKLIGYNVLLKDVVFQKKDGTQSSISNLGGLVGDLSTSYATSMIYYPSVKLVGVSRQNVQAFGADKLVGSSSSDTAANVFGVGGYVIFADYNGTASYNDDGTPGSNSSAAFSGMTSSSNVALAAPYVNASPKTSIANYNNDMQFVLGDGASPLTSASVGRSTEAFAQIYDDICSTNAGYYSLPSSYLDTETEYAEYTAKISSFKSEMGISKNLAPGIDFPVLVLDNINKAQMTEFINKYICLLTNTTTSSVSDGKYNFADDVTDVYNVVMKRVTFNGEGTAISDISDSGICLKKANHQFYIEANDTDTKASTAQFTLIDVQFSDPSTPSNIAYHLYIPCYVRKLVEYDFDIHVDSGTSYDINKYSSLDENSLVENVGTPITLEFAFTYNRTAEEWTAAANSGDSLLSNFSKDLLFDNVTSGTKPNFPTTTKMVLIDTQNHSKAYYLDSLSDTSFVPSGNYRNLKLDQFTDLGSQHFSPVALNDMLDVTVSQADNGTLVQDNSNSTVKDTHTSTKYRVATDAELENNSIQKYSATVTFKDGATKLSEHYFLTIYTPYSTNDVVYHYAIQANKTLGTDPYPSRITVESEAHAVNLFIGYIYNNNVFIDSLKVNGTENAVAITKENNSIEATIHATIGLTSSGETNIRPTLSGDSPPDIYQSFLIKLDKDGDRGLAAVNSVIVEDYTIGGKPVTSRGLNPSWNSADYTDIEIPSYIQLRNDVPLAASLADVGVNDTLTISAKATLTFDSDNGDITTQFFPFASEKRTTFVAYSNIASSSSQTASSKVSAVKDVKVDGTKPQYYTLLEEKAILNYDALDVGTDGYLPQLGINANDPKDTKNFPMLIKTIGSYNVENCSSAWDNANYLKIEIELKSKADGYTDALDIFNYLDEASFKIFNGTFSASNSSTDSKLVYIISKNALTSYYKDKVYQIPIEFKVYSGSGASNNFESENKQYSNYGVFIRVSMLKNSDSESAVPGSVPEYNNNYVKYTNARIYLEKVNPNKTGA